MIIKINEQKSGFLILCHIIIQNVTRVSHPKCLSFSWKTKACISHASVNTNWLIFSKHFVLFRWKTFLNAKCYYMISSWLEQIFKTNHMKSRIKSGNADPAINCFTSESGQRVSFYVVYFKQTTLGISCGNEMQKPKLFHGYFWFISTWILNSSCGENVEHIFFTLYTLTFPQWIKSIFLHSLSSCSPSGNKITQKAETPCPWTLLKTN